MAQIVIVVATLALVAVSGFLHTRSTLRHEYGQRSLAVARTVATLPDTYAALAAGDPGGELQTIVERIRVSTGMTYIAVADDHGIRFTHPNVERIGQQLSTDPSAALSGAETISTETGTLGTTVRAKVPILDDEGRIVGLVSVGVATDTIDARAWAAQRSVVGYTATALLLGVGGSWYVARRLRRTTFGLAPSEIAELYEHRQAVLQSIGEGVVTVDRAGRITVINGEARRLLGVSGDVEGRPLRDVVASEHFHDIVDRSDDGDHTLVLGGRVLVTGRRTVAAHGQPIGAVVSLRDRTELEAVVSELASVRGMADSLRAKAHEYSNRLHTVAGLLELGEIDEAIGYIARESRIAQSLTESYVDEIGDSVLVALLLSKSAAASERGIELRVRRDDALSAAKLVDGHDAVTAIGNLIDNAIDAVAVGARTSGWVAVDLAAAGTTLVVTVSDSGPGVDPDLVERIFEYGYTTKLSAGDRVDGYARGIGLALVAETARRYRGSVELVDSSDSGATFRVELDGMLLSPQVVS